MAFLGDFDEGREVADVAEFPVVRQERLDVEGIRRAGWRDPTAVVSDEHGVVLPRPAVEIDPVRFFGDVAKDDGYVI